MEAINDLVEKLNSLTEGENPFSITRGRKYTKIVQKMGGVHCFIDAEGNIFKPASWAAPAKGIRANLETLDFSIVDRFGGWLYR